MNSEEFDEKMAEEMAEWEKLGVMPGQYQPGEGFLGLIFRFETLNKVLVEKGIITEEEMDEKFREVALSGLETTRKMAIEPRIRKARQEAIRAGILPPGNGPVQ